MPSTNRGATQSASGDGPSQRGTDRHPLQDAQDRRFSRNFNELDLSSHLSPIFLHSAAIGLRKNEASQYLLAPTKKCLAVRGDHRSTGIQIGGDRMPLPAPAPLAVIHRKTTARTAKIASLAKS